MDLMRVTLPPIERLRPFQAQSLFFKEARIGDQVALRLGLRSSNSLWENGIVIKFRKEIHNITFYNLPTRV
jgi:hypothetical protein